jgi:predicted nucleic acid-binding protein
MKDKVFIDTNILIYAYSEEDLKRERAINLIKENNSVISIQVIDEFVNFIRKKFKKDNKEILEALKEIEASFNICG